METYAEKEKGCENFDHVHQAVLEWFSNNRAEGTMISGPKIRGQI